MEAIEKAIRDRDAEALRRLLAADPAAIEGENETGVPLSHVAAAQGDLPLLRFVVEYTRTSLNTCDGRGRDLLHYAAEGGDAACCRYLVEKCGMDPCRGDLDLDTPYETAHRLGHGAVEDYFAEAVGAPLNAMYKNPIRRGMFPDPSILRVGEDYYMVNSSFVFFPCIPISHSRDLVHWRIVGHAIADPAWSGLSELDGGRGYWAPDISSSGGRFYICATYRMNDGGAVCRRQMVVTADKPEGPYGRPIFFDEDGIDPSLFHDDDGRHYLLLNRGARIFEIDAAAEKRLSETTLLYYGSCKRAPEGPHLLKKDGWYYLFLAEGGTGPGHRETVARSRTLHGTYAPCPWDPILRQTDGGARLQRCGHGMPVDTPDGRWFMVYLCGRMLSGHTLLGRETALDPITWTQDGWPVMAGAPSCLRPLPLPPCVEGPDGDDWLTPREPKPGETERTAEGLRIRGGAFPLTDVRCRSLLLRRQTAFDFDFVMEMTLDVFPAGSEAGLTCYYDEHSFLTLGLAEEEGQTVLRLTEQKGLEATQRQVPWAGGTAALRLGVETRGFARGLWAEAEGAARVWFHLPHVDYLSDEGVSIGKRFTGAMAGTYALHGAQARFTHITYQERS